MKRCSGGSSTHVPYTGTRSASVLLIRRSRREEGCRRNGCDTRQAFNPIHHTSQALLRTKHSCACKWEGHLQAHVFVGLWRTRHVTCIVGGSATYNTELQIFKSGIHFTAVPR